MHVSPSPEPGKVVSGSELPSTGIEYTTSVNGSNVIFAVVILATLFALPFLRSPKLASREELEESLGTVLVRAFRDPS